MTVPIFLAAGAIVVLRKTGQADIVYTNVTVVSDTKITCTVNLTGKAMGQWLVVVKNVVSGVSSDESTDSVTFAVTE